MTNTEKSQTFFLKVLSKDGITGQTLIDVLTSTKQTNKQTQKKTVCSIAKIKLRYTYFIEKLYKNEFKRNSHQYTV